MAIKVGMVSLGCSKNLVDSERMLSKLKNHGYQLVTEPGLADVAVVNTCGFIKAAKEEAIDTILELGKLKEEGTLKKIIITGCLVERYKEEAAEQFPEADAVIGIGDTKDIVDILDHVLANERIVRFAPKLNAELCGERIISTLPFFTYLKVAEGCSNCCTYCAIPLIRGKFRSVPMEDLLRQAEQLAEAGVKELILVAQETTVYGQDLYGKKKLPTLLRKLCRVKGIRWIRILYCYPEEITDELIGVMASETKICHYLDLPIQHASDDVLRRMGRRTSRADLVRIIGKLRAAMPDIALRTTLISGFPGETEEDHGILKDFVREMKFERLGVFPYSREEGTPAAGFPDQVPARIKKKRRNEIMRIQQKISAECLKNKVGQRMRVLTEGYLPEEGVYIGRTYMDAPDVDGYLFFTSPRERISGDFVNVTVTEASEYDLKGISK